MKRRIGLGSVIAIALIALFALSALATTAEMYFSSDKNGANRVTNVNEGQEVWICVYDPDQNIDCDLRDKIWCDLKVFDPKTGALIIWETYGPGSDETDPDWGPGYVGMAGDTSKGDYLEETGADTGLFVSKRAFQVGTRNSYSAATPQHFTHVVDDGGSLTDFKWGHYLYNTDPARTDPTASTNLYGDSRGWFGAETHATTLGFTAGLMDLPDTSYFFPSDIDAYATSTIKANYWLVGRFENMDTLVGMYQDPNDLTDVAVTMGKITDTEATISWDQSVYKDARSTATITVHDPDENLNCNAVEYVPVFILVDPGSWNVQSGSPVNNFCMLKRNGGVVPQSASATTARGVPIRWYNIYDGNAENETNFSYPDNSQPQSVGAYYIEYPTNQYTGYLANVVYFDTVDPYGYARVMFYAQETGVSTGVFELDLNDIRTDLGFTSLRPRDVLVAYYLDPNDEDDFKLAVSYIEENAASITSFTDANRNPKSLYWIGRDPVYVQVIDANANVDPCCPEQVVVHICDPHEEDDSEWVIADETSSNSPIFFTNAGIQLLPVWDALGVGLSWSMGGYQLQVDNWKIEAFNEDSIYARYNDVYYTTTGADPGMLGLGDVSWNTAFPPKISRVRVANDVSFALMEVGDTQVYDGSKANMYFLDRQGNRVSGYVNSDCVFVEVVDPDQNEDSYRRERIDGYWDGGQNIPFGPMAINEFKCEDMTDQTHSVNALLGDTNIFNDEPADSWHDYGWAKLYVLNPRSGRWAAVDLLETGVATADFVSVTCIDLIGVYTCVPTLDVLPGDTIIAVYQDPSNHSDSSWISIKVGIGGGVTPPSQKSTTTFCDAQGTAVTSYTDIDTVYVKVVDPSHAGASSLLDVVTISGMTFDLAPLAGAQTDTFITPAISMSDLGAAAGDTLTATYTDPTDPTDTSSATATVVASALSVIDFYAGPNPFSTTVAFTYHGSGVASDFSVAVYNLSGHLVWHSEQTNVTKITWDGTNQSGAPLANGAYIYIVMATDGTNTFHGKGTVFIKK